MTAKEIAIATATDICANWKTMNNDEIASKYDSLIFNFEVFIDIVSDVDDPYINVDGEIFYFAK